MIGERLSERYEITGELGRGGMGAVYRAHDPVLERDVAVKVISRLEIDGEAEQRFHREARTVAAMDHPAIVPIYDLGAHEETLFFVMPVVEGTTLQQLIRQRSLPQGDALEIVAQVAEGLDYSHQRSVVHRDVKPENVMVSRESAVVGDEGQVRARVMDFGLALGGAASRLTRSGRLPGTLHYLSPEQILSADVDGRSDLYSLGTILYECLCGEPPFSGSRYTLLYRVAHEPPPPLSHRGVEASLSDLVGRCLAKRPAERPQRGNELAAALRAHRAQLSSGGRRVTPKAVPRAPRPARSTPLVGRQEQRALLIRRLDEAMSADCCLVAIGGEAGMGKSRLLEELAATARERGHLVLRGHFAGGGAFPYQGFGELVQDYFRQRTAPDADAPDLADLAADLLRLFPFLNEVPVLREAAGTAGSVLSGEATQRTRLYELIARAVARLASGEALVVLLEHVHTSEAAVEALQYLVRRLGPAPVLVAATYRSGETGRRHPLTRLLRATKDDPRFVSMVLGPFRREEHRELLATLLGGSQMSGELVERLYTTSEGNPFFTSELVRWLLETGEVKRQADGVWHLAGTAAIVRESLPETIRQAVESRLGQLDNELRRLLATASILGRDFDFVDLEGLVDGEIDDAVEELVHEGFLEEVELGREDRLAFTSGMVRDVLYRGLSRRRRRLLHQRHAEHLETRFTGRLRRVYARLVYHFSEGDEPEKTIEYARALAREALDGFGSEAAVRALSTALEFLDDEAVDAALEAELRQLLAAALRAEGHLGAALKEAARAVRAAERAGTAGGAVDAALAAAEIAWQGRQIDDARQWVSRGADLARRAGHGEALRKLLTLGATLANLGGQYGHARAFRAEVEALVAGAEGKGDEEEVPVGGTLLTSIPSPLLRREPGARPTPEEVEVLSNVFEPLLASDDDGNLVPHLCAEWQGSGDGLSFRFALRDGVRFSDGEPLRAGDVKRSFEHAARRGRDVPAPVFLAIEGFADLRAGKSDRLRGVEAEKGGRAVVFRLREPLPVFPSFLTDLRAAVTRRASGGNRLGTGPFVWEKSRGDEIVLARNPDYWRGTPARLDRIRFRVIPHASEVADALRTGQLDLGRDLLPDDLEDLLRDERFRSGLVEVTSKEICYVAFHGRGPLTASAEVRRALAGAVRVRDVVWGTLGRFAQPAVGLIPPGILGHDPGRRRPALSRDAARRLLAEGAGEGRELVLRGIVHPTLLDRYAALTEALFAEWRALGLAVELEEHSLESFQARTLDPRGLDFRVGRWVHDYEDPDNFTYELLHSRDGLLCAFVASSAADPMLERARAEARPEARQELYRRAEDVLLDDEANVLPLFHDVNYRIPGPRVVGLRMRAAPPWVDYAAVGKSARERRRRPAPGLAARGALHVPLPGGVKSLDPALAFFVDPSEVVPNVFETLVTLDEGAHVVPALASEFRVEDGGRRFRFRLRPNVRFHDGRRLSVRDVRFSFERLLRTRVAGAEVPLLPIRGARAWKAGQARELTGLKILSSRDFLVELEEPLPFFPAMLTAAATAVVPEGADDFAGSWRRGTAGTGPFRLVSVAAERVELEASPQYWRPGYPRCDRLIFELGMSSEAIAAAFRSGRLALASNLRPEELESLRRDPELGAGYRETPGISTYYLTLNCRRGVLADPARRGAVARALDVAGAVRSLGRVAVPAQGLIPPGFLGREGHPASLDDDGAPPPQTSLGGCRLRILVLPAYRDSYRPLWRRLRDALEAVGVEVEEVPFEAASGDTDFLGFDAVATRWLADYPDPDSFAGVLDSRWGVDGRLCGDERLDELIRRGRGEPGLGLRHAIYHEIEALVRREVLVIPLFHEQVYRFARPEVEGLRLSLRCPEVAYEELSAAP